MKLVFSERAWKDYLPWQASDSKLLERINTLKGECRRTPFSGIGKPEPLRGWLAGWCRGASPASIASRTDRPMTVG